MQKLSSILSWRQAKRLVVAVIGSTVVLLGLVMMLTPGPGLLVIIAGLGILATEFVWARRLLKQVKERSQDALNKAKNGLRGHKAAKDQGREHEQEHGSPPLTSAAQPQPPQPSSPADLCGPGRAESEASQSPVRRADEWKTSDN